MNTFSLSVIRELSSEEIKKIAAGEIVERPASIIKELIENSIDSEATFISVYLKNGGKEYIKIVDNGIGMNKEDAIKSILMHTTSKLPKENSFLSPSWYGFRGEALASISSVSTFKLISKKKESSTGTSLVKNNSNLDIKDISCNAGTEIEISNLFANIPARKKFLKTDQTEYNSSKSIFYALSLTNINIKFTLFHNELLIENFVETNTLKERIFQLIPLHAHSHCLFLNNEKNEYKIEGVITNFKYSTYDRSSIYILINNRPVKQHKLTHAVLKGYQGGLPLQKYPLVYIKLIIPKEEIDVNIHPRKEEVAFLHPNKIENFISESISSMLKEETNSSLEINFMEKETLTSNTFNENIRDTKTTEKYRLEESRNKMAKGLFTISNYIDKKIYPLKEENRDFLEKKEEKIFINQEIASSNHFIGTLYNTYILVQSKNGLVLIDQHALHEKIIFEELNKNKIILEPQELIEAIFLSLDYDISFLENQIETLKKIGLELRIIDKYRVAILGYSKYFSKISIVETIKEIIQLIREEKPTDLITEKILYSIYSLIACKKAIKGGDFLSKEEIEMLILSADKNYNLSLCPHGRPTNILISKYEIESLFKRK